MLERPICETFLEICGTHNLSNKTIYVAPVFNFYGHIVFNIIFSSATETEQKVKNRVRFWRNTCSEGIQRMGSYGFNYDEKLQLLHHFNLAQLLFSEGQICRLECEIRSAIISGSYKGLEIRGIRT